MGVLTLKEVEGLLLGADFLAAVFLGCVLRYVLQTALGVIGAQRERAALSGGRRSEDVLCPCVFRRYSTLQFTMGCTVATVACYFLTSVVLLLADLMWFAMCSDCDQSSENKGTNTVSALRGVASFFLGAAYLLMFVTAFERLWLTFSGSIMQLPHWAPKAMYAVCCSGFTFFALAVAAISFIHTRGIVVGALLTLLILNYLGSFSVVVALFFKKTLSIALDAPEPDTLIVDTAVRITTCMALSLLSTTIETISWIPAQVFCPNCLIPRVLVMSGMAFDMCFNAFCLMCTFKRAKGHYLRVFGGLHSLFLARILVDSSTLASTTLQIDAQCAEKCKDNTIAVTKSSLPESMNISTSLQ